MAGMATLLQVKKEWTIDDLWDAHELLDIKDEAEAAQLEHAKLNRR